MGLRFVELDKAENVEVILNEGLELFGLGRIDAAIEKWRAVLAMIPGEPRALDYLSAAGVDPSIPQAVEELDAAELTAPIEVLDVGFYRRQVASLVGEKKYEEALEILIEARRLDPGDSSLSRSLSLLKQHLTTRYRTRLGLLETVVQRTTEEPPNDFDSRVWQLIDGIATIADIIELSPVGEFRTLRGLCRLLDLKAMRLISSAEINSTSSQTTKAPASGSPSPSNQVVKLAAATNGTDPDDAYEALFREAQMAYLRRNHVKAIELFEECLAERPGDSRVTHNLKALRKRVAK